MAVEFALGLAFVVVGIVLLLVEAVSPGFFIGVPAVVLIVIGLLGMFVVGFFTSFWTPITVAVVAPVATYLAIKFYSSLAPPRPPETVSATSLVGKMGLVTRAVEPHSISGKVNIDHQIWSATSQEVIPEGTRVQVVSSEGVHVVVERAPGAIQSRGPSTSVGGS